MKRKRANKPGKMPEPAATGRVRGLPPHLARSLRKQLQKHYLQRYRVRRG